MKLMGRFISENRSLAIISILLLVSACFLGDFNPKVLDAGVLSGPVILMALLGGVGLTMELVRRIRAIEPGRVLPFNFILAVLGFWVFLRPYFPKRIIWSDSVSYVLHSEFRQWLYPKFIDLFVPAANQQVPLVDSNFHIISWVQFGIIMLALISLMAVLYRRWSLAPMMLFGLFGVHQIVFRNAAMFGQFAEFTSSVLSEALGYAWFIGGVAFLLYAGRRQLKMWSLLGFGGFCYIGLDIAPKLLPMVAILLGTMVLLGIVKRDWRALIPGLVFSLCVLGKCSYNYSKEGIFAPTPISNYTLTPMAVQFFGAEEVNNYSDPRVQAFLKRLLELRFEVTPSEIWFINRHFSYTVPTAYREAFGVEDASIMTMSRDIGPVLREILLENQAAKKRWHTWLIGHIKDKLWDKNKYFTIYHFVIAFLFVLAALVTKGKESDWVVAAGVSFAPILNVPFCSAFQGVVERYYTVGEFALPITATIAVSLLVGDKVFVQMRDWVWPNLKPYTQAAT